MDATDNSNDGNVLNQALFDPSQYEGGENTEESGGEDGEHNEAEPLREQDRFLPIANVARIMKKSIPKSGKIAKEAKDCVQECVSEFVSFITSEASERCKQEKRKTINGEDILFAMSTLGFDNFVEPLKIFLQKFRESTKGDKPLTGHPDAGMEELGASGVDDSFVTVAGNLLAADQQIIYATSFPTQITSQQVNF